MGTTAGKRAHNNPWGDWHIRRVRLINSRGSAREEVPITMASLWEPSGFWIS